MGIIFAIAFFVVSASAFPSTLTCKISMTNSGVTIGTASMNNELVGTKPGELVIVPGTGDTGTDAIPPREFQVPAYKFYVPKPGAPEDPQKKLRTLELPFKFSNGEDSKLVAVVEHEVASAGSDNPPSYTSISFGWVYRGNVEARTDATVYDFKKSGRVLLALPLPTIHKTAFIGCRLNREKQNSK